MIKKVGILTFHASHNYGSMLQAWALQTYLRGIGIDAEEINLRTRTQKNLYPNPIRFWGPRTILYRVQNPVQAFQEFTKWHKFESFLKTFIQTTDREYHSWEEIEKDLPSLKYDAIICGGDQIWNTKCIDFDKSYYLPSALSGIKKIAYSPSLGGFLSRFDHEETRLFIRKNLSDFEHLSVREEAGAEFLSTLLERDVPVVTDPTLLLTPSDYTKIIKDIKAPDEDYIFYYSPFESPKAEAIAAQLGERMNLPVIISNGSLSSHPSFKQRNSSGPLEFLSLLINARFVCGYSYHLVVFSLLFHKDFAAFNGNRDARVKDLLSRCSLINKATDDTDTIISNIGGIDTDLIDKYLLTERTTGVDYLNTCLNGAYHGTK